MGLDLKLSLDERAGRQCPLLLDVGLVSLSDDALMQCLQSGNHEALAVLFQRYRRLLMHIALHILRDAGEAEDLVQSVFLEIFQSAAQFDPRKGTARTWILQYIYHRGFSRRQYLNLRGIYGSPLRANPTLGKRAAIHRGALDPLDSARTLEEALARLDESQRTTLELVFYEGMTMHEIADLMHESFDTVRHRYYRGLDKLRSMLFDPSDFRPKSSHPGKPYAHMQS